MFFGVEVLCMLGAQKGEYFVIVLNMLANTATS